MKPTATKLPISIIVPAWNEENNLTPLVQRINAALKKSKTTYEVIVIDDFSTDTTQQVAKQLSKKYPVRYYSKTGNRGKALSLLQGFDYAKYPVIGMIDADLQYPPEAIPAMVVEIQNGADIVVANRKQHNDSLLRKFGSRANDFLFNKLLHRLDCDVQSGLKVFRKEITQRVSIDPTPWTFDLEFLVRARNLGYKLSTVDIEFAPRTAGESKINFTKAALEIGSNSIKVFAKLKSEQLFAKKQPVTAIATNTIKKPRTPKIKPVLLPRERTAAFLLTNIQKVFIIVTVAGIIAAFVINWYAALIVLISSIVLLYFADLLFNLYLVTKSFSKKTEVTVSAREIAKVADSEWPTYTIYCPLYKEWEVVPQFTDAITKLDYPKNKLQVMLLLEEDDKETIAQVGKMKLPEYFDVVVVPDSKPKTKPKALNIGLQQTRGEYAVIYDAEDMPESDQLKKAVLAFRKCDSKTVCVQAKLNFYNPSQNLLTRLFTLEYSLWFDLILAGLHSIKAPIPLGGTSNHFKTADLRVLQGWDPYNVTEDADLGMRIIKKGFKTAIVDSTTYEEANSSYKGWIKQRSRWVKGYMQTYFVHMRTPGEFMVDFKRFHLLSFQLNVGGKVLALLVNPLMWLLTITYFAARPWVGGFIDSLFLTPIFYIGVFTLVIGNFLYTYYYMMGAAKRKLYDLIPFGILIPFYWLMMSAAAMMAAYELVFRPHYWHKTKHGLHLQKQPVTAQPKLAFSN